MNCLYAIMKASIMLKPNRRFIIGFLVVMNFFIEINPLATYASPSKSACDLLETQYPILQSPFFWLSEGKVVFQVGLGLPAGGIIENPQVWYSYQLFDKKLERLATVPDLIPTQYIQLAKTELAAFYPLDTSLTLFSPSGRKALYVQRESQSMTYWLRDFDTDTSYSLEIPKYSGWQPYIHWFADEHEFIIQTEASQVTPIYLVRLEVDGVHKSDLTRTSPWKELGFELFSRSIIGYWFAGMSDNGRYLVFQPDAIPVDEKTEHNAWIVDLTTKHLIKPDFFLMGDFQIRWKNDNTFIALSNLGVIEYNIRQRTILVLLSPDDIGSAGSDIRTGLSPKANYLISPMPVIVEPSAQVSVSVCMIPQGQH